MNLAPVCFLLLFFILPRNFCCRTSDCTASASCIAALTSSAASAAVSARQCRPDELLDGLGTDVTAAVVRPLSCRQPSAEISLGRAGPWKKTAKMFLPPFSNISLLYLCFASQMVLLGFPLNSSLLNSPVTSIHAGACDNKHCERESGHGRST